MSSSTRRLNIDNIIKTIEVLGRRIEERFPGSGLGRTCLTLLMVCEDSRARAIWLERPRLGVRLISFVLVGIVIAGLIGTMIDIRFEWAGITFTEFIQLLEAGINDVVLISAAVFFLGTIESRLKRNRANRWLHELRALAHVIDMHQLTKDPVIVTDKTKKSTPSSPVRKMNAFELKRYLDYCSEMLSLVGKVAAIYVQDFTDSVTLASVTELEQLTTGLSRKIWQKIIILENHEVERQNQSLPEPPKSEPS